MEKKTYDSTFKQEAIRLVKEQGEKTAAVAKKLGVPDLPEVLSSIQAEAFNMPVKVIETC